MKLFTHFSKFALIGIFLVSGLSLAAQTTVLSDNFSDLTAGTFSNQDSTGMSNLFPSDRMDQWNHNKCYQVYYGATVLRIGAKKAPGILQTDTLNLSGSFSITFSGYSWAYDANNIHILLNGNVLTTVTFPNGPISSLGDLAQYTINGSGGTGKDVIAFEGVSQYNRFLLTDIAINTYPATAISVTSNDQQQGPYAIQGILFINTSQPKPVYIYSATGSLVRTFMSNSGTNTVSLPQGLYLVKIGSKVYKVLVQ
ncbi:MAG: T9SS type A sorting domain-containing protein [Microbacter sp.]